MEEKEKHMGLQGLAINCINVLGQVFFYYFFFLIQKPLEMFSLQGILFSLNYLFHIVSVAVENTHQWEES